MDKEQTAPSQSWLAVGREIADLLERVDPKAFEAVVEATADTTKRLFFSGQGRSGLSAEMAAMRFMHIGREVHFVGEATAPSVRKGDVMILVSGSGETPVSVSYARIAKSEGATLVVLTHKPQSTLAGIADVLLPVPSQGSKQLGGNLFELSSLILLDSIVMEHGAKLPDAPKTLAYNHTNLQ